MDNRGRRLRQPSRRQYRLWMRDPIPTPPRTTAQRLRAAEQNCADNAVPGNIANQRNVLGRQPVEVADHQNDISMDSHHSSADEEAEITFSSQSSTYSHTSRSSYFDSAASYQSTCSSTQGDSPTDVGSDAEEGNDPGVSTDEENNEDNLNSKKYIGGKKYHRLEDEVFLNTRKTKFEIMLLIWSFSFRHSLTAVAIEDLCKLVNTLLGNDLIPSTKYMFRQVFGSINYCYHFFCADCSCYIKGVLRSDRKTCCPVLRCPMCSKENSVATLNDGNFFVTLPVKDQLINFLESTNDILELIQYRWNRKRAENEDYICDIFDGALYQKLVEQGKLSNRFDLSLTFSTDEAVKFKACKNTMWPIQFRLNELPPTCRFDQSSSMLAGIWYGKNEPDMSLFLPTFVKEAEQLYSHVIDWKAPTGVLVHSQVVLLGSVLDSKAKPIVQNIKQFNGFFGCGYCYHPGVIIENAGNQAKYPMNDDGLVMRHLGLCYTVNGVDRVTKEPKTFHVYDRSDEQCRRDIETAEQLRRDGELPCGLIDDYQGVKGKNSLYCLPFYDLVFGFPIDYMHAVLLGVVRTVTCLWFDAVLSIPFSIIGQETRVDERLLNICPPSSISRRPRSTKDRIHWKANEWRSWLLYYSLPCLLNILPPRYLKHHCLLVSASYMMLRESISIADLEKATLFLFEYVSEHEGLYGPSQMLFNTHLLLHLGKMVKMMGPWWCYSAFSFESGNGCLLKLAKGVRGTASQIAEKYSMCRIIPHIVQLYNVSEGTLLYSEDLMCYRRARVASAINTITVLGAHKYVPLSEEERQVFAQAGRNPTNSTYERMIKDGIKYHSKYYTRQGGKSNDSVAKLISGQYVVIERILLLADPESQAESIFILVRELLIERGRVIATHRSGAKAPYIRVCSLLPFGRCALHEANHIVAKCILMNVSDNCVYVTEFPNNYEKD